MLHQFDVKATYCCVNLALECPCSTSIWFQSSYATSQCSFYNCLLVLLLFEILNPSCILHLRRTSQRYQECRSIIVADEFNAIFAGKIKQFVILIMLFYAIFWYGWALNK